MKDIEHQIRILQGIPGSDWPGDEPEDREWSWMLYVAGGLGLLSLVLILGYFGAQAYAALDAVFG